MLAFMRRKANSWLMIALFGVIIFVFAINFGPWAGNSAGDLPFAAEVNGSVISIAQFQTAYAGRIRQIQQFRPDYTSEKADSEGMSAVIVDQLIGQELLAQLAAQSGLGISDKELAKAIKERIFGADKPFDAEEYERIVSSYFQMAPSQFEKQLRKEMLAEEIGNLIATGGFVSEHELKESFNQKNTRASLDYVRIVLNKIKVEGVTDAMAEKFSVANAERILAYYTENSALYNKADKKVPVEEASLGIAHVLLKGDLQKTAGEKAAQDIIKQFKSGVTVDKIAWAKEVEGAAKGSTPLFNQGNLRLVSDLGQEVDRAAFSLSSAQSTSDTVFEVQGALVVIRLKEKQLADEAKFATEKEGLRNSLGYQRQNQFLRQYVEMLKKDARIVYNPSLLKPSA